MYGETVEPTATLTGIAFVCPGCRRHCTTFVPLGKPWTVHWCGAVVCELAGPLSIAVELESSHPKLELRSKGDKLLRGLGSAQTAIQLTRDTNIDASLELWSAVMKGSLVPRGVEDVWVPSVTAWRFGSCWNPDFGDEFRWPHDVPVTSWRPARSQSTNVIAAAIDVPDAAYRCKRLSQRMNESQALLAIGDLITVPRQDQEAIIKANFPQLWAAGSVGTCVRLISYFQLNGQRMAPETRAAFSNLFIQTKLVQIATQKPASTDPAAPHSVDKGCCCCSKLPSFLTTLSNRVSVPAVAAKTTQRSWPGSQFAVTATELWQQKWGTVSTTRKTRIQVTLSPSRV